MKRDAKQIAEQIVTLVTELVELAGGRIRISTNEHQRSLGKREKDMSGATGGLRILSEEGYFDSPKQLPEIIERLRQEGRHYSNATISMGLLNLVRERKLIRFRDKGDKKWKYAIRR
ncbi:MAG: hypothetical protein Q8R05_00765 [Candidatus Omnitrophota bacterium]|nr:hypothetical protein [Candidatus Omnitrophota bacterium]